MDAAIDLPIEGMLSSSRVSDDFRVSGIFDIPAYVTDPGGAAVRFSTDGDATVHFFVVGSDKKDTITYSSSLFLEPYSDRAISVFNGAIKNTSNIGFRITSSSIVEVISFGIIDSGDSDRYPQNRSLNLDHRLGAIEKPIVITREEWSANPPRFEYTVHPYFNRLTLHHAAGWQAWTIDQGKEQVKAIQEFHQNGRGWNDIGYHFLVDLGGNIYQGRPETVLGAHVGGANTGNIGVCILGCYHPPETGWACFDTMTDETENALIHLYAWVAENYSVDPQVLLGHRDYFGNTACPGDNVWPLITEMREEISIFIASGGPPVTFRLLPNFPNPFNSITTIPFYTDGGQPARISIRNILGREIITLEKKNTVRGYNNVSWNGLDQSGLKAATGVYFYQVVTRSGSGSDKMVYLK